MNAKIVVVFYIYFRYKHRAFWLIFTVSNCNRSLEAIWSVQSFPLMN